MLGYYIRIPKVLLPLPDSAASVITGILLQQSSINMNEGEKVYFITHLFASPWIKMANNSLFALILILVEYLSLIFRNYLS